MSRIISFPILFAALVLSLGASAAEPELGPVVPHFGPVMAPPPGSWGFDPEVHYKASMDMYTTPDFPGELNRHLVSAARFLNMNARDGVPRENVDLALVVHGKAAKDLLTDEAHRKRYNEPNPNTELLAELGAAGVSIYLCSQTAAFRGMAPEEFNPVVTMALSAMNAHVRLQKDGYDLIPF